jgi:hypothetical protein
MIVRPFSQVFDPKKVFEIQNAQYRDTILLADVVPAASSKVGRVSISNLGHFFSMYITGSFETLKLNAVPAIVDDGVSYLSGQLIDGAGQRKLFSDRIPFDLFLSPGRRKSVLSTTLATDPVGGVLYQPMELEYLWAANSDILLDVQNTSSTPLHYEILFHGVRLLSNAAADRCRQQQG